MKVAVWYHITEKHPNESGLYLAFKSYSMGDDCTEVDYFYYEHSANRWLEHRCGSRANVQYWCDFDPMIFEQRPKTNISPAEQIAFDAVMKAKQNYELISGLTNG
jgi:hypothetical protein